MKPLAEELRPKKIEDFIGQEKILGKNSLLRKAIKEDNIPSMIFYGPPGTGKTTLAKIVANKTKSHFEELSAVSSGIKDFKLIIERAELNKRLNEKTILFIDEIHRWNKKQQDALLPYIENGTIILIGATTENPSFEVNAALLSRCRVFTFEKLDEREIEKIIKRAVKEKNIKIENKAVKFLKEMSNGDARVALNILDYALALNKDIKESDIKEAFQKQNLYYDKHGKEHHDLISALIKSMRAGKEDAAIYYLVRMVEAGEDPLYIARRLIVFASEDIGLENSLALNQAINVFHACHFIGLPECRLNLIQGVVYMCKNKKSRKLSDAYEKARRDVERYGNLKIPLHLKNDKSFAQTEDYNYKGFLPEKIKDKKYLS
ncbi:MAG TPA: replication-associated recombination protein A [Candidatus Pacearchaeota archaeon]|nr:replication-associated recombination protein A [Candidatus Pacearchaeota archaeon]